MTTSKVLPALLPLPLALDAWALWILFHGRIAQPLLVFWALHGVAAGLTAVTLLPWLPASSREPRGLALGLLGLPALFMPVVGAPGLLLAMRVAHARPLREAQPEVLRSAPRLDVFSIAQPDEAMRQEMPAGQMASIARDQSQPAQRRIRAVLALREMPPRLALPVMRHLLSDPNEEIRLLAYGIGSEWEHRLTDALQSATRELRQAQAAGAPPDQLGRTARRVAEMHMEFIYQGLAQGDLRVFALEQALEHCELALRAMPRDTGLRLMVLRLSLATQRLDAARAALEELAAQGAAPTLWRPYAAEIEWMARRYDQVANSLRPLDVSQVAPRLRPVVRLWKGRAGGVPAPTVPAGDRDASWNEGART